MKTLEPPRANGHARLVIDQIHTQPRGRKRPPLSLLVGGAVLICVVALAAFLLLRPKTLVSVVTQPATQGALVQSVTASGTVNPQDTINVGTQISGTVSELDVDYNSRVH